MRRAAAVLAVLAVILAFPHQAGAMTGAGLMLGLSFTLGGGLAGLGMVASYVARLLG